MNERREELKEGETHDTDQNRMTTESDSLHALGLNHWPVSCPLPLLLLRLLHHDYKYTHAHGERGSGTGHKSEGCDDGWDDSGVGPCAGAGDPVNTTVSLTCLNHSQTREVPQGKPNELMIWGRIKKPYFHF